MRINHTNICKAHSCQLKCWIWSTVIITQPKGWYLFYQTFSSIWFHWTAFIVLDLDWTGVCFSFFFLYIFLFLVSCARLSYTQLSVHIKLSYRVVSYCTIPWRVEGWVNLGGWINTDMVMYNKCLKAKVPGTTGSVQAKQVCFNSCRNCPEWSAVWVCMVSYVVWFV